MWLQPGQQSMLDKEKTNNSYHNKKIIQKSSIMKAILKQVERVAKNSNPVIFIGGHGTGRSMFAKKLYLSSHKNNADLICINCSQINSDKVQEALLQTLNNLNKKTLLIESIDDLSVPLQTHLLQHLRDGKNRDFRVIATASEYIYKKIEKKEFREDLFSHLSQNLILTPLLVERKEDIPELLALFLKQGGFQGQFTSKAIEALKSHDWKGNVVELKNVCSQISTLYKYKAFDVRDLPISTHKDIQVKLFVKYNPKITLEELINYYISESLNHFKSKSKSAKALGISVKTIYNKIDRGIIKA